MTAGEHAMNEPTLSSMQQRPDCLESENRGWKRLGIAVVVIAMLALVLLLSTYVSAAMEGPTPRMDFEQLSPYTGSALRLDMLTFLCSSNRVASGGYWGSGENVEQGGWVKTEPATSTWRITLNPEVPSAEVLRLSGLSRPPEEPETYTLEVTPSGGFLLVWQERLRGVAPQVITIDPTNSSFVYSTQHTNVLRNRGSVFWGTCIPYL